VSSTFNLCIYIYLALYVVQVNLHSIVWCYIRSSYTAYAGSVADSLKFEICIYIIFFF